MKLRCRGPSGQATLSGLEADKLTISEFQALLAEKTGVPANQQELLAGFPPSIVQLPADAAASYLSSLPLSNGDSIVVRKREEAAPLDAQQAAPSSCATEPASGHAVLTQPHSQESEDAQLARAIAASLGESAPSSAPAARPAAAESRPAPERAAPLQTPPPPREVERGDVGSAAAPPSSQQRGGPTSVAVADESGSAVVRREIASDNSCLFNAVGYVMERTRGAAPRLRQVIVDTVAGDPEEYTEAFLGKPNAEYCAWILNPQSWGGAIELSILARHFAREVAAYDVQTRRCDVYGQDAGYDERVMLIYDGLHYDALAVAAFEGAPEEVDVTVFEAEGRQAAAICQAAAELVAKAHEARQFTDTANFTLRCGVCQIGVKGEKEAVEHARATGHQRFGEY